MALLRKVALSVAAASTVTACLLTIDDQLGAGEVADAMAAPDAAADVSPNDEDATIPGAPPEVDPDAGPLPEMDATVPDAGPDAANPCQGRADGFAPDPAAPLVRCCGGSLVALNTTSNCGACGIKCAPERACEQVRVGKYSCRCSGDSECASVGTGVGSTCYPALDGWCNCQCPNAATSCINVCSGGSTCYDITGQNYCSYP